MIGAIILQVILIALNAVFTCAETAIVSLNDNQLEEMAKKDEAKAALLSGFKAKQERFLTAMQLVSMASVCLGSAYAALVFRKPLEDFIGKSGQAINPNVLDGLCVTAISLVLCIVTMIFGRMVPKRLAAEKEEEMALGFIRQNRLGELEWMLGAYPLSSDQREIYEHLTKLAASLKQPEILGMLMEYGKNAFPAKRRCFDL